MEQKDFILREIEKIGKLLLFLIDKFIPAKTIQEQQRTEKLINSELLEHYGNDLEYILSVEEKDFDTILTKNSGFNFNNIELLADLLFTLANNQQSINKKYLLKALELYEYINTKSKTFSFERDHKITTIKSIL